MICRLISLVSVVALLSIEGASAINTPTSLASRELGEDPSSLESRHLSELVEEKPKRTKFMDEYCAPLYDILEQQIVDMLESDPAALKEQVCNDESREIEIKPSIVDMRGTIRRKRREMRRRRAARREELGLPVEETESPNCFEYVLMDVIEALDEEEQQEYNLDLLFDKETCESEVQAEIDLYKAEGFRRRGLRGAGRDRELLVFLAVLKVILIKAFATMIAAILATLLSAAFECVTNAAVSCKFW